jgi:hypothetical protein
LKFLLCAEDSGLRFRVAARKKGIFISQYGGQSGSTDFFNTIGRFLPLATGSFWPILLKKSDVQLA